MAFSIFQTATGTLQKITDGGYGETVSASYDVEVDPDFGKQRVFTNENEEITGQSTIITSATLHTDFDVTHDKWRLVYEGRDFIVRKAVPRHKIGTNTLEHIEVVLT